MYPRGDYRYNGSLGALAARWKIPRWKVTHQAQRLPSEKPPQQVASEGEWFIRPQRVRQFITDNASLVDIRKCDKFWLIDLLTNSIFQSKDDPEMRLGGPRTAQGVDFLSEGFEGEGG